jgi:integrase
MGDIVKKSRDGKFIGWYVRFVDVDGRRKQRASHQPTKALARTLLIEIEARVARGLVGMPEPVPSPKPELTVAELCERYVTQYSRPRIKDLTLYRTEQKSALRRVLPKLGDRPVSTVTRKDIAQLRDELLTTYKPNTVMSTLRPLSTAFVWGAREGIITCPNPCTQVERPRRESLLEFLDQHEVTRLVTVAEESARQVDSHATWLRYVATVFTLHTGVRKGELLGLRWIDLDLTTRRLDIARSYRARPKSGVTRHLKLPTTLLPLLAQWRLRCPKTPDGLVFPVSARGTLRQGRKLDMLGLPKLLSETMMRPLQRPWHALRHTFASHFVMSGGNILTLQKILGHADIKMTLVYAHLAPDFLGEEMDRLRY